MENLRFVIVINLDLIHVMFLTEQCQGFFIKKKTANSQLKQLDRMVAAVLLNMWSHFCSCQLELKENYKNPSTKDFALVVLKKIKSQLEI